MSNKTTGEMNKQNNPKRARVPRLRFPEFREAKEWEVEPLRKLAKRCTGKNAKREHTRVLTNSAEYGVLDQRDYFEKDIANQGNLEGYYIVEKGDYVYNPRMSTSAPVGPISRNNVGTGVMSPLYTVFRFASSNNDFFAHYFKSTHWHHYMRQASSTGARHDRMSITNDDFMDMPLPAPAPKEQQKIADCLSTLDELIIAEAHKLDALRDHKGELMSKLFPREGEIVPRLRFPDFQDSEEWMGHSLESISDGISSGRDKSDPEGMYHLYGSTGIIGTTSTASYSGEFLLVARVGANAGLLTKAVGKFGVTDNTLVIRLGDTVNLNFVFYCLGALELNKLVFGSGQPLITGGQLKALSLYFPGSAEQQRITDCLSSLDDLVAAQSQKIDGLKAHKKGLMQQLFTGLNEEWE
ncbi:restriction endonuclease subunit S [Burkholderia cenocepacia]|uniref:restriction endonuclease subunit S n=1 Tax=Burkholderia cenocepacia TaxID=95486 RepID=UPI002AB7D6F8|nr:restriction endonuclease subunit S [Burkholderia cenocepacia]